MREPAVAGQFYPLEKSDLLKELKKCFSVSGEPKESKKENKILAAVCPHAGYVYSGPTAAFSYKALKEDRIPETVVIIGPNHSGVGAPVSISSADYWSTPLGDIEVDAELAKKISDENFILEDEAHFYEHSGEVQLPFLKYVYKNFKIVMICLMDQRLDTVKKLGEKLAKVLDPKKHVVIASTDFSHFVGNDEAYEKDMIAINTIKKLDEELLYKRVEEENISMCGPGGVAAAIIYSKKLGAKSGKLLKYQTSGDITGDKRTVVGYGSLIISK